MWSFAYNTSQRKPILIHCPQLITINWCCMLLKRRDRVDEECCWRMSYADHPRLLHLSLLMTCHRSISFPCPSSHPTGIDAPSGASHTTIIRGAGACELVLVHCTRTENRKRFHATTLAVKEGHTSVIVPRKLEKISALWRILLDKYSVNGSTAKLHSRTDYYFKKIFSLTLTVFLERGFGFRDRLPRILWL